MDSSEAIVPGTESLAAGVSLPERAFTKRAASVPAEWIALAVALVVPWWLPVLAATVPTFYKEWLFALALGFAGLIAKPVASGDRSRERADPFVLAAIAAIAARTKGSARSLGAWADAAGLAIRPAKPSARANSHSL